MAIDKVTGKEYTGIAEIQGVAKSNISKLSGQDAPTGGGGGTDIVFSDITETTKDFSSSWSSSNPFPCALPSSASSGDFVLILLATDMPLNGNYVSTPSGWTSREFVGTSTSDNSLHAYTRVLDGTEGSVVNITPTFDSRRGVLSFSMICENIDTSNPVGTNTTVASSGSTMTVPTATSSAAGTFIVFAGFDGADGEPITMTNNGGFTLTFGGDLTVPTPAPAFGGHVTAEWQFAHIGASTSTGTTSVSFSTSDGHAGIHLMLQRA